MKRLSGKVDVAEIFGMAIEEDYHGWKNHVELEFIHGGNIKTVREIYENYVQRHREVKAWVKYAQFEVENGEGRKAWSCYKRAVQQLIEDGRRDQLTDLLVAFEEMFNNTAMRDQEDDRSCRALAC
ncbi:unnamed protein product [Calypogeia fissa]